MRQFYNPIDPSDRPRSRTSEELAEIRRNAKNQTFSELKTTYGLLYINAYAILSPPELQAKFLEQYQGANLYTILDSCPLSDIRTENLMSEFELTLLLFKQLKHDGVLRIPTAFLDQCCDLGILTQGEVKSLKEIHSNATKRERDYKVLYRNIKNFEDTTPNPLKSTEPMQNRDSAEVQKYSLGETRSEPRENQCTILMDEVSSNYQIDKDIIEREFKEIIDSCIQSRIDRLNALKTENRDET